ncbi:MAG TPA: enoyl-CoA hydratase-related protein [Streptosporangiaceae bacterium]|nr:enoyl-CoA hydratase-related protein [Streptosporangiaceae bacterium]
MSAAPISFAAHPGSYRHWRLDVDGAVATLTLDVDPDGGVAPGYELKKNSYDLGVYIELNDAVQRLRFTYPQARAVIVTSALNRMFCAGANIGMLAQAEHSFKVNFCKFCNETLAAIEDAGQSGQVYIAAVNGTAAGGGYELALACERILLADDGSSTVSLPEVPLLGVLPGTGGLTRLTDKRGVRRDLADVFATTAEGVRGQRAVDWRLVDVIARPTEFDAAVRRLAEEVTRARGPGPAAGASDLAGIELTPLSCYATEDSIRYEHVRVDLDRRAATATLTIAGPAEPVSLAGLHAAGAGAWPLAAAREMDDAISRLRFGEPELGTWLLKTAGDPAAVLATDEMLLAGAAASDWLAGQVTGLWKRTLRRLEATSRSLIALIEPGSCFAGTLLELALAADRQYMLDGVFDDGPGDQEPAALTVGRMNAGPLPAASGATRLAIRFGASAVGSGESRPRAGTGGSGGSPPRASTAQLDAALDAAGKPLAAADAVGLGLVTAAPDDLDWDDEIRLVVAERAGFSPDALSGLEASLRFAGPESTETKILGRLSAWQNWIFLRPNASGPRGALRRYGTGQRADFDRKRV